MEFRKLDSGSVVGQVGSLSCLVLTLILGMCDYKVNHSHFVFCPNY